MKKRLLITIGLICLAVTGLRATVTTQYLNYVYFNNSLEHLRMTGDKSMILGIRKGSKNALFWMGAVADLVVGGHNENLFMSGIMGFATCISSINTYFLLYSSDLWGTIIPIDVDLGAVHSTNYIDWGSFGATAVGIGYTLYPYLYLSLDLTFTQDRAYPYFRVFVPIINLSMGIGLSPFDSDTKIVNNHLVQDIRYTDGSLKLNIFKIDTTLFNYIRLGLEYIDAVKTVSPEFIFFLHNLISPLEYENIPINIYAFVKPDIEFSSESVQITGFEMKAKFYYYFPIKEEDKEVTSDSSVILVMRDGLFAGICYRTPKPGTLETIGESGFGFEFGYAMMFLDNYNIGSAKELLSYSFFWNWSDLFDTYPVISIGVKVKGDF